MNDPWAYNGFIYDLTFTDLATMKSNQSLHLTVKEPPNPTPVRTLGIFCDLPNEHLLSIIERYLSEVQVPKDAEFLENVKDEVLKVLSVGKVLTVAREGRILHITIEEPA